MIPLALFPIRCAPVGSGLQILILWLVFIPLQLIWCGVTPGAAPVPLSLSRGQGRNRG